jgi:GMP synthase PP-ATPase subunit
VCERSNINVSGCSYSWFARLVLSFLSVLVRDLHKDEVRLLGLELGLPAHLVWRQPFPGPGLAVRIICADAPYETSEDARITEQLAEYNTDRIRVSLCACRTVGVQGDSRSYSSLVALSSTDAEGEDAENHSRNNLLPPSSGVHSATSGMHAAVVAVAAPVALTRRPNWHSLFHLAKEIPKRVHGVNRVVYVFGAPLKRAVYRRITPTHLTPDAILQLQQADDIVNVLLQQHGLVQSLSQVPVILFPIDFEDDEEQQDNNATPAAAATAAAAAGASDATSAAPRKLRGCRSICIRTFVTNDFMTGVPALPTLDASVTQASAAASPSPAPSPVPQQHQPPQSPSSPSVAPADAFTPALDPIAAPVAQQEHVPLSSVRFPTIPMAVLEAMVQRIQHEVPNISRVCYDLTCKPPATTEWE